MSQAALRLHALGGEGAPLDLASDLRRLLHLPPEALGRFWQALGPCLADKITEETEKLLDVFCSAYRVPREDLEAAIKSCRFLVHAAARRDLSAERLGEDLDRLCPDELLLKEVVLAGYEPAKAQIRQAIAVAAVVDHGRLLTGAQWRVDTINASERGTDLRVHVAMLTLHYRDGAEMKRITLQVLPDMMGELKGICEQILS